MSETKNGTTYEMVVIDGQRYTRNFRNGFEILEKGNKPTEWIK